MKAHYLGHIVFYIRDLETSVSFYEEILGWKRIISNILPFKAATLTSGNLFTEFRFMVRQITPYLFLRYYP
ncbi:MAG: VOC family protein [Candidatus Marinimicrobia bacterium]|nr:VOC family protein [Candidatus Neomarinimicrobiota bacterium]